MTFLYNNNLKNLVRRYACVANPLQLGISLNIDQQLVFFRYTSAVCHEAKLKEVIIFKKNVLLLKVPKGHYDHSEKDRRLVSNRLFIV